MFCTCMRKFNGNSHLALSWNGFYVYGRDESRETSHASFALRMKASYTMCVLYLDFTMGDWSAVV